jgi:hypothetical protein
MARSAVVLLLEQAVLPDEIRECVGDDLVAARRQVNVRLEEQVRSGKGRAQRVKQIESRYQNTFEGSIKAVGRRITNQLAARFGHDRLQPPVVTIVDLKARRHQDDRGPRAQP